MTPDSTFTRRHFAMTGALAVGAALVPSRSVQAAASYSLDALPYALDALAPHIDAMTMEIHHGKHHAAYIKNLNTALEGKADLAAHSLDDLMTVLASVEDKALQTTIRNNGGGHWNHAFFWETLAPADKSGKPSDELAKAIDTAFGSMDDFKKDLRRSRRQAIRIGLGLAQGQGRQTRGDEHPEPGQPAHERARRGRRTRHTPARTRCLGARLLPQLPEPPSRLRLRLVERGELGQGLGPLC